VQDGVHLALTIKLLENRLQLSHTATGVVTFYSAAVGNFQSALDSRATPPSDFHGNSGLVPGRFTGGAHPVDSHS
jgi:hypothetical protein